MARATFSGIYGHNLQLEVVSENYRQDIAGNFSVINVQVKLISNGYAAIYDGANKTLTVNAGGESKRVSVDATISQNQNKLIFDNEFRVPHDPDGKKSVNVTARLDINAGGYDWAAAGLTRRLPDIPRASTGNDVTAVIGQPVTININRKNDAFKHAIWATYGSFNKQITTANVDTSFSWTPPLELCEQTPNSASGFGNITIITYDGSREIGRDVKRLNLSIPDDVKPTLTGFTLTDGNAIAANIVSGGEHFIKILSDIRVNFGAASGAYGSTITGYYAEIVGKNQSTTTNGGGFGTMNYSGQVVIRARVTDSRGRTSNAIERTVTILDYFPPILKFDVARTGLNGGTLTITRTAKVAPLIVNGSQKNKMTLTFKVKPLSDSNYTSDTGLAAGSWTSISELINSPANLSGQYPADKTWEVVGRLEDKVTSAEFVAVITTEGAVISYSRFGVGINKIWERGALDVKGDIYANDKLIQMHQLTQKNGDLIDIRTSIKNFDNARTSGFYVIKGTQDGTTNAPSQRPGLLEVFNLNERESYQRYTDIDMKVFIRFRNWGGKWRDWLEYPNANHANLKRTEWTSTGVNGVHYKRQGDVVTLRINVKGTGGDVPIGRIPKELVPIQGTSAMLSVTVFSGVATDNKNLQINSGGDMTIIATGSHDIRTQVTWSI